MNTLLTLGCIPVACSMVTDIACGKVYNAAVAAELLLVLVSAYGRGSYMGIIYMLALTPVSLVLFSAGLGGGDCKLLLTSSALLSTFSLKAGVYMCLYFVALLHPAWYLHRGEKAGVFSAALAAIPALRASVYVYPILIAAASLGKRGVLATPLIMLAYAVAASYVA